MTRTRTIHKCNVCDYKTNRKYDRDKHVTRMHGSNRFPVTVDKTISSQVGYGELTPSIHTETNNNNTVTTENYEKVVDIANGWKRECEKVEQDWKMIDNELYNRNIGCWTYIFV